MKQSNLNIIAILNIFIIHLSSGPVYGKQCHGTQGEGRYHCIREERALKRFEDRDPVDIDRKTISVRNAHQKFNISELELGLEPEMAICALGKDNGLYFGIGPSKKKLFMGSCFNKKPDGRFTWWHKNGMRRREIYFKKGKKSGALLESYPNGDFSERGGFLNGKRNGKFTLWKNNGEKEWEGQFENGIFKKQFLDNY